MNKEKNIIRIKGINNKNIEILAKTFALNLILGKLL